MATCGWKNGLTSILEHRSGKKADLYGSISMKHFYGKLKESAENCNFENNEVTLTRDVFITNLTDPEIQKELLEQTVEPRQ